MSPDLYRLLSARAHGRCECGCGAGVPPGEVDHFFGRAKSDEVEFTCWVLTPRCHYMKTNNSPNAEHWLTKFIAHCGRWARKAQGDGVDGYAESAVRAQVKLEWNATKRTLRGALT